MPGENGFSLIEKLNVINRQQTRKILATALTGRARNTERLKALSAGFEMCLAKPIEPSELIAVVADFADWNNKNKTSE